MKRLLLICTCVCLALSCCGIATAFAAERKQIFVGDKLPTGSGEGVFQPTYAVAEGGSSVRYAAELPSANKFVRMANFDGSYTCDRTSIAVVCSVAPASIARVSLRYRLYEGDADYAESDVVLSIGFRGGYKQFSYNQLQANVANDFTWRTLSTDIVADGALTTAYLTVEFCYKDASVYSQGRAALDIDDVSLTIGGAERCVDGGFNQVEVATDGVPDVDYNPNGDKVAASKALMLPSNKIDYRVNTVYTDFVNFDFDTFAAAKTLPAGKSDGLYTDAASGSQFLVYDGVNDNTFLRIGNFNSTKSNPLVRMPFTDNDTGTAGNIPKATRIYVNFDYRLYIDEDVLCEMNDSDTVLELSTRRSTLNNSGKFTLDNLTLNAPDDGSWHSMSCVLQTNLGSTAFMEIIFYSPSSADFFAETYIDIDNLYVSDQPSGKNYACDNGTWEGTVQPSASGTTPLNPSLVFNENYGTAAAVSSVTDTDYDMTLPSGGTFGVLYGKPSVSGVYDLSFVLKASQGDALDVMFDGRGGFRTELVAGQNLQSDDVAVTWKNTADGYECVMSYAKYDGQPLGRIDFVNRSSQAVRIDDLFVGQVKEVCAEAGNYSSFSTEVARLKAVAAARGLNDISQKAVDNAVGRANKLNEFASQARMSAAIEAINQALNGATSKADLSALAVTLAKAEAVFVDGKNYTKASRALFESSYFVAKNMTEQNSQSEVDRANADLTAKIAALTEYNNGFAVAAVGGAVVVSAAAVVFKRKQKEGNDER